MGRAHFAKSGAGQAVAILALVVVGTAPVCGQDGATFATVGPLGVGTVDGRLGAALHAAITHRFGRSVVSGRGAAVLLEGDFLWDDIWDVALLYGRTFGGEDTFVSVAVGVGYVGGVVIDEDRTLGLALEAQVLSWTSSRVSLSVYGFGNLNGRRSFGGLTLGVRFGRP